MAYQEQIILRTRDCDMYGRWKPSAMLETMQETAIAHCEAAGLPRRVTDEAGVVWVLSRCRTEFSRVPRLGARCQVETCALPTRHLFFPRLHVFRDGDGRPVGSALGLWLLMDVKTRIAVLHEAVLARLPIERREDAPRMPGAVKPLDAPAEAGELLPRYAEFDLNGHVNNARYLDWCENAMGPEALREREIAAFEISYDREIRWGQRIRTELRCGEDAYTFLGFEGDRRCFGARIDTVPVA